MHARIYRKSEEKLLLKNLTIDIKGVAINNLRYTNNIILLASNLEQLQELLITVEKKSKVTFKIKKDQVACCRLELRSCTSCMLGNKVIGKLHYK